MRRDLPWIAWLLTGIALERWSPLSKHMRCWLRITPQGRGHRVFEMVFLGTAAWFCAHVLHEHIEAVVEAATE